MARSYEGSSCDLRAVVFAPLVVHSLFLHIPGKKVVHPMMVAGDASQSPNMCCVYYRTSSGRGTRMAEPIGRSYCTVVSFTVTGFSLLAGRSENRHTHTSYACLVRCK